MHVQDLKRWHWVLVGLVVGLGLSYAWSMTEPNIPRRIGQRAFEQALLSPAIEGHPRLQRVVVYPKDEDSGASVVTGEELVLTRGSKTGTYTPFMFVTTGAYQPVPASRATTQPQPPPDASVLAYIHRMQQEHPDLGITFRYAWERTGAGTYLLWTALCVMFIGGVWPSVVSLLVGAGLGFRREAEDTYDLDRFGKGAPEPSKPAAPKTLSEGEQDQLAAVQAEIERRLQEGSMGASPSGDGSARDGSSSSPAPVRSLSSVPDEPRALQPEVDEAKEYTGEFYPVARPGGKHHRNESNPLK